MSQEARIKELIKRRGTSKAKLTQFTAYLASLKSHDHLSEKHLLEIEMRVDRFETLYDSYDTLQSELEQLADEPDDLYADRELFERTYYRELAAARDLINKHRSQGTKEVQSEVGSNEDQTVVSYRQNNVRLPKINLPHFSGGYQNWLEFKDIYVSLIHLDKSMDDINKFHYLRASLHGSASLVIRSLDFKSENYQSAWKLLCERYDNKQLLVNNHVQALFNIAPIHKESSHDLRQIVDVTNKNLRSLATLNQPVQHWDTLVIHIMSAKLDPITSRHWEEHRNKLTEPPSLNSFISFLSSRCNLLETLEEAKIIKNKSEYVPSSSKSKSLYVSYQSKNEKQKNYSNLCSLCNKPHFIFRCDVFKSLSIAQRLAKAKEFKVCLNCLRPGHNDTNCVLSHCKYCKVKHNTLLHSHDEQEAVPVLTTLCTNENCNIKKLPHQVLLSTARVKVTDSKGQSHDARILLDNGSMGNFVTQDFCDKLELPVSTVSSKITGINNQESNSTKSCSLQIESYDKTFKMSMDCIVLPKITSFIPSKQIEIDNVPIPSGLHLADPSFFVPSSIDILVGAHVFWSVIGTNRIDLGKHNPQLFETKLGWLLSGIIHQTDNANSTCMFVQTDHTSSDTSLTRFWELDTIPPKYNFSAQENECELIFQNTTRRNADGRFEVNIPLKEPPEVLGDSYQLAKRRYLSLERRLDKDPALKQLYLQFMKEYENLGHMSESTQQASSSSSAAVAYYLPHHGVIRESSTTTKLRAVFDASAITTTGKSFNDIQLVGPRIQDDLFSILLRFRQHKYVVSADIEKMYRQILVSEVQRPLQQILWREDSSQVLKTYTLNTVTYGTASAPFLSTRCLLQLSQEAPDKITQEAIARDFYVDDFLSGTNSIIETVALCKKVTNVLESAKFHLRKWQSNSEQVLDAVTEQNCELQSVNLSDNELSKTLGLYWQCDKDTLTFQININSQSTITKRQILSAIAQVFDPLGLVSPCIVEAKILMQRLWVNKCSWDEPLTGDILIAWKKFASTLPLLNNLSIPRWVSCSSPVSTELHIFTDSSEKAYGACLYVRSVAGDGSVHTHLLASKSKVAPLKATTIPRLELCGALLGVRLCKRVLESLQHEPSQCIFWCDSMIVIGWLSTSPSSLRPFVKNRVSEIQDSFGSSTWHYVPSKQNPADLVSRGLSADQILNSSLWWRGPGFLALERSCWPTAPSRKDSLPLPETVNIKGSFLACADSSQCDNNFVHALILRHSDYAKLQRIVTYVLRFTHNCRPGSAKLSGPITTSELSSASRLLIRTAQQESFPTEYELLKEGKALPAKNRLLSLSPFFETDAIRVGGRLFNSFYDYNVKHPFLMCSKHALTKLIFRMIHLRYLHAGPQLILTNSRHNYWVLGGKPLAKHVVRTCIKCIRIKGETIQPKMGNLPKERVHLEYPFLETGTDYAGPILIADRKGRGCRLIKAYICIFVCLATRALHLELVSDLTKEAFIAALNRFIARRGKPRTIFSDNGTTFVGTYNELCNVLQQNFTAELADSGINFSFIPAYTPHFGGVWESAVKSVKHHLRRILGLAHLTYEEMSTCLIQIEAILNSRPITPLSDDPSDLSALTPSHFLIGRSLSVVPHPDITNQRISNLQRFQRIEYLKQHFWNRFSNEYVTSLQQRTRWRHSQGHLKVGTMVLIKDQKQPPLLWLLGRIVKVIPGRDGIVRVADIKTRKGVLRRAFNTICPLPTHHFEDNSSTPGVCCDDKPSSL